MKRPFALPILLLTLLVANPVLSADYQRGTDAALKGDYATALSEWEPLAEQGNATPQFQLGWLYEKGYGVILDYKIAGSWYQRAAEQGYAYAQSALGRMYRDGYGVPKNTQKAYMWFSIAAQSWDPNAKDMKNEITKTMSSTQLETAQRLARECLRKKYKGC